MDRLRKILHDFQLKVRNFIQFNWHNEPEGDKFRCLDSLLIVGGVHFKSARKWQRVCWNACRVVSVCSFVIFVFNAMDEVPKDFHLTRATWYATSIVTMCLCFVKDSILNQQLQSIQTARNFINSNPFASGDTAIPMSNDAACRKKFFQRLQLAVLVVLSLELIDEIGFNVPFAGIEKLFGSPRILQYLGPTIAKVIHFLFLLTFIPLWVTKYCAGTGICCSLLYGFNTEHEIFVRGFDNILDNVYSDVDEEFPSTIKASPEWKRFQRDQLYWNYLKQRVHDQVKLHVLLVENLKLLVPVVKNLFGIIYYHAMMLISPILYVLMANGLSGVSFVLISAIATQLVECYMWCRLIDSLKDTNEKLELKILDLMTKIPYSQFHRKKYAEMRTTLCIMKTFVRNHEPFSCFGVFPISVEAITELLHIAYTVFTFLRDMGKKNSTTHRRMKQRKLKH